MPDPFCSVDDMNNTTNHLSPEVQLQVKIDTILGAAHGDDLQNIINDVVALGNKAFATALASRSFQQRHAEHRQYDDFLDDVTLVQVCEQTKGKGGVSSEVGDWVLAKPYDPTDVLPGCQYATRTIISNRLGWNCAVAPWAVSDESR